MMTLKSIIHYAFVILSLLTFTMCSSKPSTEVGKEYKGASVSRFQRETLLKINAFYTQVLGAASEIENVQAYLRGLSENNITSNAVFIPDYKHEFIDNGINSLENYISEFQETYDEQLKCYLLNPSNFQIQVSNPEFGKIYYTEEGAGVQVVVEYSISVTEENKTLYKGRSKGKVIFPDIADTYNYKISQIIPESWKSNLPEGQAIPIIDQVPEYVSQQTEIANDKAGMADAAYETKDDNNMQSINMTKEWIAENKGEFHRFIKQELLDKVRKFYNRVIETALEKDTVRTILSFNLDNISSIENSFGHGFQVDFKDNVYNSVWLSLGSYLNDFAKSYHMYYESEQAIVVHVKEPEYTIKYLNIRDDMNVIIEYSLVLRQGNKILYEGRSKADVCFYRNSKDKKINNYITKI